MTRRALSLVLPALTGCPSVARTHAGIAEGAQGQLTATGYAVVGNKDDSALVDNDKPSGQLQADVGFGTRFGPRMGLYGGVRVVVPWLEASQLDLYMQMPSSRHVMWGVGLEAGMYMGAYTSVTVEGDQSYVTLTTRGQVVAGDLDSRWLGGQLAVGIESFLLFAGANYAGGSDGALLLGGIGFVPDWHLRAGTRPPATDPE